MSAQTRQGVSNLDGPRNGRQRCTHRWEFATRMELVVQDGEAHEYRVRDKRCIHCQTWQSSQ